MFAYCNNCPVIKSDPSGYDAATDDLNGNGIPDYLEARWEDLTEKVKSNPNIYYEGNGNKRPYTGTPGSTYVAPNGDRRTYGPDGNPEHDYDHDDHGNPAQHPHDPEGGHNHNWVNGKRGPAYSTGWESAFGIGMIIVFGIACVAVALDDATGVGVIDDFLLGPLGAGIAEGINLIS